VILDRKMFSRQDKQCYQLFDCHILEQRQELRQHAEGNNSGMI